MSFDLAMQNGDLVMGTTDLKQVRSNTKLAQTILKIVHTPIGSNPYFLNIGSLITENNIGDLLDAGFIEARAEAGLIETLQLVRVEQNKQQARGQTLTAGEILVDLEDVEVQVNPNDPRQYNIKIVAITGELDSKITLQFNFSTRVTGNNV